MKYTTTYLFFAFAFSLLIFSCESDSSSEQIEEIEEIIEEDPEIERTPLELGQDIATKTQMVLGKNLMKAINEKGSEYAVSFCSTKAIHLTDSTALSLNAKVKRVSDKNRNPNSKGNWDELNYIQYAKRELTNGKTPEPSLLDLGGNKVKGLYPIITNQMCMQCHGNVDSDISPETLAKINTLYPNDLATGYKPNELRGIWVVEMDK